MTTAPRTPRTGHRPGVAGRPVAVAALLVLSVGAVLALVGALVAGSAAASGVAVGAVMVLAFFGLGALVLDVVAGLAPALSLLVALLTYTLQVVLVGLAFVGFRRSGLLDSELDATWLGVTVIVGTLTWVVTQLVTTVRMRQPVYDLPTARTASDAPEAPTGEAPSEGSGGRSGAKEAAAR